MLLAFWIYERLKGSRCIPLFLCCQTSFFSILYNRVYGDAKAHTLRLAVSSTSFNICAMKTDGSFAVGLQG